MQMRAEVREVTLIMATMSKERKFSLRKVNRVEIEVIHVVTVELEVLFADVVRPTAYHGVADIR